jgi:hypothetical protein
MLARAYVKATAYSVNRRSATGGPIGRSGSKALTSTLDEVMTKLLTWLMPPRAPLRHLSSVSLGRSIEAGSEVLSTWTPQIDAGGGGFSRSTVENGYRLTCGRNTAALLPSVTQARS